LDAVGTQEEEGWGLSHRGVLVVVVGQASSVFPYHKHTWK